MVLSPSFFSLEASIDPDVSKTDVNDNVGVSPIVLARNVKLHPLLILLTLIVAGKFFGFLGLLLAVPVTAVIKVFVQETVTNLRSYRLA